MANKKNRNESLSNKRGTTFKVGDGVSWGFNGDRHPGTVLFVSDSGREVFVSSDDYKVIVQPGEESGYVEGNRTCEFTTVERPLERCDKWKLRKSGEFTRASYRSAPALVQGRQYARNPHF